MAGIQSARHAPVEHANVVRALRGAGNEVPPNTQKQGLTTRIYGVRHALVTEDPAATALSKVRREAAEKRWPRGMLETTIRYSTLSRSLTTIYVQIQRLSSSYSVFCHNVLISISPRFWMTHAYPVRMRARLQERRPFWSVQT